MKKQSLVLMFALVAAAGVSAQQTPARDTVVRPTGTAVLGGVVVSDDAQGKPIRRVTVQLISGELRTPDAVTTDDNGRFVFSGLPAGTYTLMANRAGFVQTYYGAKRPGKGPGVPIALGEGEKNTNVTLRELHGSVIAGAVRDQNGHPMPAVTIIVTPIQLVNGQRRAATIGVPNFTTDDRGQYRVFGLAPGEYLVSARPSGFGAGAADIRQVTVDDIRHAQQVLTADSSTVSATTPGAATVPPPPPPGQTTTYAPVYFPGTLDPAGASTIAINPNEERSGVDLTAMLVPTARVTGTVFDPDGQPAQSATVQLVPPQTDLVDLISALAGSASIRPVLVNGTFSFNGITPGRYKVAVRGSARGSGPPPNPMEEMMRAVLGGVAGGAPSRGITLWAMEEIVVDGRDVQGLSLRLQPGMSVSGKIVYQSTAATPPAQPASPRVMLMPSSSTSGGAQMALVSAMMSSISGTVNPDLTFSVKGVVPDKYRANVAGAGMLGAIAQLAGGGAGMMTPADLWTLKSVMLNARDVTDAPFDVQPGQDVTGLVVTFTDRPSEISGHVLDNAGKPAPGFPIVVFSTDRTYWTAGSRRVVQSRPSSDGKFSIRGLPAGEYYMSAVTDLDPNDLSDPSFLELLTTRAFKVTLADGEQKTQDLKLTGGLRSRLMPARAVVLLLALCFASPSGFAGTDQSASTSGPVTAIDVQGLKHLHAEDVLSLGALQTGRAMSVADIDAAVARLLATGLVSAVRYRLQSVGSDVHMVLDVDEPEWREIVTFDNFIWFNQDAMVAAIAQRIPGFAGQIPNTEGALTRVTDALQQMLTDAKRPGQVTHVVALKLDGRRTQRFLVSGVHMPICTLRFPQTSAALEREVALVMKTFVGAEYSLNALSEATDNVWPIYKKRGYLQAALGPATVVQETGGACRDGVNVSIPIIEGPVFHMGTFTLVGLTGGAADRARKPWPLKPGAVYDASLVKAYVVRIVTDHLVPARVQLNLEPVLDEQTHVANVTLTVK